MTSIVSPKSTKTFPPPRWVCRIEGQARPFQGSYVVQTMCGRIHRDGWRDTRPTAAGAQERDRRALISRDRKENDNGNL